MNMNLNDNEKLIFADEGQAWFVTNERVSTRRGIFRISEIQRVEIKDEQRAPAGKIGSIITRLLFILGIVYAFYSGQKSLPDIFACCIPGIISWLALRDLGGLFLVLIGHGKNGATEIDRVYYWQRVDVFEYIKNKEIEADKKALNTLRDAIGQAMSMR